MKQICVIGAGFGGLALAIRLQAAGFATVLIEASAVAGGTAHVVQSGGYSFDTGPGVVSNPGALAALWRMGGADFAADVELLKLSPTCRMHWADGGSFDWWDDPAQLRAEVARFAPADLSGFEEFVADMGDAAADVARRLGTSRSENPPRDLPHRAGVLPALLRHRAWRSVHALAVSHVASDKLRQVLCAPVLAAGANPMSVGMLGAGMGPLWAVKGGMSRLVAAMQALFENLGGEVRLGDRVTRIHTIGARAHEVETASGWRARFDAVAYGGDLMHGFRDLLGETPRGAEVARRLARRRWSPSVFAVHFALEGRWPGIPHHTLMFPPRFEGWLADIFDHGVLPRDMTIFLCHPTITDPELSVGEGIGGGSGGGSEGNSLFSAFVLVPSQRRLPIDWDVVGPVMARRVLDEVGLRFVPDIHDRVLTVAHRTPVDFARDVGGWRGSAYGLEASRLSALAGLAGLNGLSGLGRGCARAPFRDPVITNLYLVGASTQTGAGIAGVVSGAERAAALIAEDLG